MWTSRLIVVCSDEDDRNLLTANREFPLEIWSSHTRHRHVEQQTACLTKRVGSQELFRGRKRLRVKTEFVQQIRQRLAHRFVIIDYGDKRTCRHQPFLAARLGSV